MPAYTKDIFDYGAALQFRNSLPMHTEFKLKATEYICDGVLNLSNILIVNS